jgi:hypothetical protein
MEPYTVSGVARSESKASSKSKNDVSINEDNSISSPASDELLNEPVNTNLLNLLVLLYIVVKQKVAIIILIFNIKARMES